MRLHGSCTTDHGAPRFDHEWQRRAFGLAIALSEFGHYRWEDFQRALIETIGRWERAPESERGDWRVLRPLGRGASEGDRRARTADDDGIGLQPPSLTPAGSVPSPAAALYQ